MAKPRMDLSAFVGKLLEEQDGDVLREGIRVLSQALMETEVAGLIGADRHERTRRADRPPQRLSDADVGYAGRARSSWRFQGAARDVLPVVAAAAPARRARAAGGRAGSVRAWRLDAESRRPDEGARARRRVEVGGLADLRRARPVVEAFRTRALTASIPICGWMRRTTRCGSMGG